MMKSIVFNKQSLTFELVDEADVSVFGEIFIEREYRVLDDLIKNASGVVIDVGAHKGLFTAYVRALNSEVSIFAFEPEENNFSFLKKNLVRNHVKNVVAKNLAVSGVVGQCKLYLSADSHNHSLVAATEGVVGEKLVFCTTLEDIFRKNKIEKCALVKLDCEGSEFAILSGLSREIFTKIGTFYIEYHSLTEAMRPEILRGILQKNGFKVQLRESPYDKKFGFILARRV